MDVGLILPSYRIGATTESIDAGAETAGPSRLAFRVHYRPPARRAVRALGGLLQRLRRGDLRPARCEAEAVSEGWGE